MVILMWIIPDLLICLAQLELEGTMTLKSDLQRLGQTILNSFFLNRYVND